jgi:hypothetical protein
VWLWPLAAVPAPVAGIRKLATIQRQASAAYAIREARTHALEYRDVLIDTVRNGWWRAKKSTSLAEFLSAF